MIKKWLKKDLITKKEYYYLYSSDSLLPKAYGLPKIHKDDIPFRIIVSSVNTALYSLASFLHKILFKSIPAAQSHVNNSFELCNKLSDTTIDNNEILISLDVVSLFTNVPLDLAIDSINNRWDYITAHTKIPQKEFIFAVNFILASTYFTFNNTIYKQTYGTPMGSPLSPMIADLVMQDLETRVLNGLNLHTSLYYRYVDDIIMTAPSTKVSQIVNKFNSYHDRLKFTVEYEKDRCLSFLDLSISISKNRIYMDWFQKKSFSGRVLSFFSNHPFCQKIGIVYNLLDRALLLSHPQFYRKNIELVVSILVDNGYPLELIFRIINRRIKFLISNKLNKQNELTRQSETTRDNEIKKMVVVFPYVKNISEMIISKIKKSKKTDLTIGYRCLNKLDKIITVQKDKNHISYNSNVIYKINCKDCDASYVGQTKRQLQTRLKEHTNNIRMDSEKHSVISEHIIKEKHTFDWEGTKILDFEINYHKRLISEMLHIKEQNNGLNSKKDTELLNDAYFDILKELTNTFF